MFEGTQVFWDKGNPDRTQNQRFINHSHLSAVEPEIVSQLIVPEESFKEGKYPVEKLIGHFWSKFVNETEYITEAGESIPITIEDILSVATQILEQMKLLLTTYGVVIADRNGGNMIVYPDIDNQSGHKWRVKHIDLAIVYDAVQDTSYISDSANLSDRLNRQGDLVYRNPSHLSMWLSSNIMFILSDITFSKKIYDQLEQEKKELIDEFNLKWLLTGEARDKSKMIEIDEAIAFLDSLKLEQTYQSSNQEPLPVGE